MVSIEIPSSIMLLKRCVRRTNEMDARGSQPLQYLQWYKWEIACVASDVFQSVIETLCVFLGWSTLRYQLLSFHISCGLFSRTFEDIPVQCSDDEFYHAKKTVQGFIATGAQYSGFANVEFFDKTVDMVTAEKRLIAILMELKLITIPSQAVFVGREYLKHALMPWSGTLSICYDMLVISQDHELMFVIWLAHGWSFRKTGGPMKPV